MKHSFTYYIILFILKLKGIKKNFSKAPINVGKIRKEDVPQPKGRFFKQKYVRKFKLQHTEITEVKLDDQAERLVIFIHGGAFISGPAQHHWDALKEIAQKTSHTCWMCNYPKAPENNIAAISENIDAVYAAALENYSATQIILLGDSVGGTLIAALTQRLIKSKFDLPRKIILISPVMDARMSNPKIQKIDAIDPMLSKAGVLSAKKMCAGQKDLKNEMISPINGSFDHFPQTILFLADHDITFPDQQLLVQKMRQANINIEVIQGNGMPHIWPLLPVMKEAKVALKEIIFQLNKD